MKPSDSKYTFRGMKRKSMYKNPDKVTSAYGDKSGHKGRSSYSGSRIFGEEDQESTQPEPKRPRRRSKSRSGKIDFVARNKQIASKKSKRSSSRSG